MTESLQVISLVEPSTSSVDDNVTTINISSDPIPSNTSIIDLCKDEPIPIIKKKKKKNNDIVIEYEPSDEDKLEIPGKVPEYIDDDDDEEYYSIIKRKKHRKPKEYERLRQFLKNDEPPKKKRRSKRKCQPVERYMDTNHMNRLFKDVPEEEKKYVFERIENHSDSSEEEEEN